MKRQIKIVKLLDRNTLVGVWVENPPEGFVGIEQAHVLRRYGTKEGLPELTRKGPLKETDMQPVFGDVALIPRTSLIVAMPCDADKWAKIFP